MLVTAFLRALAEGTAPPGGLILAILSDEEAGGDRGARFLVESYVEVFAGVRHALGEFAGATLHLGGRRVFPIQVAEKRTCWLSARVGGPGGHGSLPLPGGAMARLARLLLALERRGTPIPVTPVARRMIETVAQSLPRPQGALLRRLLDPRLADIVLRLLPPPAGRSLEPLLRNTVSATVVRGDDAVNVIPCEIEVRLDGRLLPGFTPDDLMRELRAAGGDDVELSVLRHDPVPPQPDLAFFDDLASVLRELDPEAIPVPLLMPAVSDGRWFARLGIQTYGFVPLRLPPQLKVEELAHAANERVPADAVRFGAEAVFPAIDRYGVALG